MYKLLSQKYWTEEVPCHFEFRNPQPPFPLHNHDFHEIVIVYSGEGVHVTANSSEKISAGDIIVLKPGQIHGYNEVNNLILMNVLIRSSFFTNYGIALSSIPGYTDLFQQNTVKKPDLQKITRFKLNKMQEFEIRALLESTQSEITNQNLAWSSLTATYVIQLFILLLRIYNDPSYPDSASKNNAGMLIKYVKKNYKQNFTMQDLMSFSAMSESTVLRTFKRITGYPPFVYQMRLRIFTAINEITSSNKNITGIAYDVGFNDSNYFSRMFRKFTGFSPSEYKKKFKTV